MSSIRFNDSSEAARWLPVNDDVMGGVSQSHFEVGGNLGVFSGRVSLENNGGFASVRRATGLPSDTELLRIHVRGDGKSYQLRLRTHDGLDGVVYAAPFDTEIGQWQRLVFRPEDFTATFRGRAVLDAPGLFFGEVHQLGFLISEKQEGYFQLQIAEIEME
ncbi:CIA30 family protein [Ferrimonas marina]|uniref:Complex I intermediate-associated protein 30 (CIA30) n=1 Tax=Ferrimonas marina TaxID=299255 RepID=A0A1M5Z9Q2_9GAMM|nr:CIA30 family protein [Ferrimonas marina]SHI20848.1 Complex I intermediate-associated protein 30 (CIA30) [Ferrimonas marina]